MFETGPQDALQRLKHVAEARYRSSVVEEI
jgi:hypothetical protein